MSNEKGFTCPKCFATSFNPNDLEEGYCGRCHEFTGRMLPGRKYRDLYEIGAIYRRQFRAGLDLHGISYTEHKGWTQSDFIVTGTGTEHLMLQRWIRSVDE